MRIFGFHKYQRPPLFTLKNNNFIYVSNPAYEYLKHNVTAVNNLGNEFKLLLSLLSGGRKKKHDSEYYKLLSV